MTERTRQNIMIIFLGAVLALTVATVWLFGAQRREEITALGPAITVPNLGFTIRMPKGWERLRGDRQLLRYRQPLTAKVVYDSFTERRRERQIFFISIRPNASDAEVLGPLVKLARFWDDNDNDFHSFMLIKPGPPRLNKLGYERRSGVITLRYRAYRSPFMLIRYEQIKSQGRIFWCVMAGNTQLNEADRALLEAVVESFDLREDNI